MACEKWLGICHYKAKRSNNFDQQHFDWCVRGFILTSITRVHPWRLQAQSKHCRDHGRLSFCLCLIVHYIVTGKNLTSMLSVHSANTYSTLFLLFEYTFNIYAVPTVSITFRSREHSSKWNTALRVSRTGVTGSTIAEYVHARTHRIRTLTEPDGKSLPNIYHTKSSVYLGVSSYKLTVLWAHQRQTEISVSSLIVT